jgi:murein L,D-transpeptidase YafK
MRRRLLILAIMGGLVLAGGVATRLAMTRPRAFRRAALPRTAPVAGERVLVVVKRDRVLGLYVRGELKEAYPIGLGPNPNGPKEREGDGRTPEGQYYICTRNSASAFHLFLGLSYPNEKDARAARRAGRISEAQYRSVVEATRAGRRPPWDTPLGGEIGIHGEGAGWDWTAGCIAMENEDVDRLWRVMRLGDPVVIR